MRKKEAKAAAMRLIFFFFFIFFFVFFAPQTAASKTLRGSDGSGRIFSGKSEFSISGGGFLFYFSHLSNLLENARRLDGKVRVVLVYIYSKLKSLADK